MNIYETLQQFPFVNNTITLCIIIPAIFLGSVGLTLIGTIPTKKQMWFGLTCLTIATSISIYAITYTVNISAGNPPTKLLVTSTSNLTYGIKETLLPKEIQILGKNVKIDKKDKTQDTTVFKAGPTTQKLLKLNLPNILGANPKIR